MLLIFATIGIAILAIINKLYNYRFEPVFGWFVFLVFISLGAIVFQRYNTHPTFYKNGRFAATILETPEEKPNSYKSLIKVNAVYRNDSVLLTDETILVYFEKENQAKLLKPGNTILFQKVPEIIKNNGNPYEFDYKSYLARKKIYRRIYLPANDWKVTGLNKHSAKTIAENTREKLLSIYRNQNLGENETEILSALTLGYKRGLDPETKRIFSSAGAMHVLAVSGLHVGIIFGMFALFFGFLRKRKYGKYLFVIAAILILWSYAFITGLSPSVMRAATMFSLVVIATNINRRASIYNSLAASALLLLIINPNNLFEVGFQLSYAAVFGIVFLQPKLARLWPVQHKLLKFFWTLLTVSVAAQIATFPITAFYFNQFPTYFWLSNLVVIPAAFLLIALGVSLLAFSSVPYLGYILALCTKWSIKLVYLFLVWIENLPHSVQEINITRPELLFLLVALLSLFVFIENARIRYLKLSLTSILIVGFINLAFTFRQLKSTELIVYNHNPGFVVHLIKGPRNYVLSNTAISDSDYVSREIESVKIKKGLQEPHRLLFDETYNDNFIFMQRGMLYFEGKSFWLTSSSERFPYEQHPNYILSQNLSPEIVRSSTESVIISNAYPKPKAKRNIYFLRQSGAFQIKWP